MSDLDLSVAIAAAQKMCHDNTAVDFIGDKRMDQWTDLMAFYAVAAAAPIIAAQVAEQIAAAIKDERDRLYPGDLTASRVIRSVLTDAVDIAREAVR